MRVRAESIKRRLNPEPALAATAFGGSFLCGGKSIGALGGEGSGGGSVRILGLGVVGGGGELGLGVVGGGGELVVGEIGGRVWRRTGGRAIGMIGEGGMERVRVGGIPADGAAEEEAEESHGGGSGGGNWGESV